MDPLSAFGLACNVTQLISFSLEALKTFKEISSIGTTTANEIMVERSRHIKVDGESCKARIAISRATGRLQDIDAALASFIQKLAEGHTKTQELIRDEAHNIRDTVLKQGQDTNDHIEHGFRTQRDERLDQERYHLLPESLSYPEMNARLNQITESHTKTFEWIYDDSLRSGWSPFSTYLQSAQNIYWIQGKAGSGKSCLMKFISQDNRTKDALRSWEPQRSVKILSHFFWSPGSEMKKSPKGFLLSIVYQLFRELPGLASRFLTEGQNFSHRRSPNDWSERKLLVAFKQQAMLGNAEKFCFLVDGLDEVDQEYGHWNLIQLIDDLASLDNVKLCVSSRPEAEFRMQLAAYPHLKLEDFTRVDMESLARDMLQEAFQGYLETPEPASFERIVDMIVYKAQGVFLWAAYALKSLRRGLLGRDNWPNLQKRLETLPKGIENLYRAMWERLSEDKEL
ncbi:MAG: hypothetical protein Q9160_008535 [Pyrenula sp. 1 TL-2023]